MHLAQLWQSPILSSPIGPVLLFPIGLEEARQTRALYRCWILVRPLGPCRSSQAYPTEAEGGLDRPSEVYTDFTGGLLMRFHQESGRLLRKPH